MFISCSASMTGGAIRMSNGHCILSKLCGVECNTTSSNGPFSYVNLNSGSINKILQSTVSKCSSEENGNTLCHLDGNIEATSVNASMNQCALCSVIDFELCSSSRYANESKSFRLK